MELDLLCCPICYETFNPTDRLPKLIPACGHTLCQICLKTILSTANPKCPLDKKPFGFRVEELDQLPTNQLITHIWEEDTQKVFCQNHNEVVTFFCFTDKCKICDLCVCTEAHKRHKTKPIKVVKKEAHSIRKQLDELCSTFEKYYKNMDERVDDMQCIITNTVRKEFEKIKLMISQKEDDIIAELNSVFIAEKWKISQVVGSCSKIRKTIETMLKDLVNVIKSEAYIKNDNYFRDIQGYVSRYQALTNLEAVDPTIKSLESNLQELCLRFQSSITPKAEFLEDLKIPLTLGLSAELYKIFSDDAKDENSNKNESVITSFTTESHLDITLKNSILEIVSKPGLSMVSVDLECWEKADTVQFLLIPKVYNDIDCYLLDFIWQHLPEAANLKLKFANDSISSKVADIMIRGTKQFSSIEIDLENYNLANKNHVTLVICRILSSANAKNIMLKLKKTILNEDILKNIFTLGIPDKSNIERFSLILEKAAIKDKDLEAIKVPMPNVRHFTLNLSGTGVTDETLNGLVSKTLSSMKHLENFRLLLGGTRVTDRPFKLLIPKLINLNKLCLNLTETKATDSVVKYLAEIMPHLGPNLQDLMLGFSSQYISDKVIAPIFVSMPKVKSFALGLSSTPITDRTIADLVQNTLSTTSTLETLKLWVHRTQVTNISFDLLIQNMNNLKSLELGFATTSISEPPVEKLINEKLPTMTSLTDFKLDVSNSLIKSSLLKGKIDKINQEFAEKKKKN